jgi:hypothetical protein
MEQAKGMQSNNDVVVILYCSTASEYCTIILEYRINHSRVPRLRVLPTHLPRLRRQLQASCVYLIEAQCRPTTLGIESVQTPAQVQREVIYLNWVLTEGSAVQATTSRHGVRRAQ